MYLMDYCLENVEPTSITASLLFLVVLAWYLAPKIKQNENQIKY